MKKNIKVDEKKKIRRRKRLKKFLIFLLVLILIYFVLKVLIYFNEKRDYDLPRFKNVIKIEEIDNSCNVSDGNINLYIPSEFKLNKDMKSNGNVSWYDLNYRGIGDRDATIAFIELGDFKNDIGSVNSRKLDSEILKINKIDNGYDLIKNYYKNLGKKVSVFSSVNRIKLNRMSLTYLSSLVTRDDLYLLEGDVSGILCIGDKSFHSVLFEDDYAYVVDFYNDKNDYFDYDKVIEMISMIEFND